MVRRAALRNVGIIGDKGKAAVRDPVKALRVLQTREVLWLVAELRKVIRPVLGSLISDDHSEKRQFVAQTLK